MILEKNAILDDSNSMYGFDFSNQLLRTFQKN